MVLTIVGIIAEYKHVGLFLAPWFLVLLAGSFLLFFSNFKIQ